MENREARMNTHISESRCGAPSLPVFSPMVDCVEHRAPELRLDAGHCVGADARYHAEGA